MLGCAKCPISRAEATKLSDFCLEYSADAISRDAVAGTTVGRHLRGRLGDGEMTGSPHALHALEELLEVGISTKHSRLI